MVQKHIPFPWLQCTPSGLLTGQSKPTRRPNKLNYWITGLMIVRACYFHSHHAFIPYSLPDQKTQNEKVMNRNFPVLDYPDTVSLKYLMRPSEPLRVRDAYNEYNGCLSPCVTDNPAHPATASSGRSIGPAQVVSCPEASRLLPKATG